MDARSWWWLHSVSSLLCTLVMLLTCVTGLPLIFADEIEAWTEGTQADQAALGQTEPLADLDTVVAQARARHPAEIVRFLFVDAEEAAIKVVMAPGDGPGRAHDHRVIFDARRGTLRSDEPSQMARPATVLSTVRRLHTDLLAGSAGEWLLAMFGALFAIALVSGAVIYRSYMRNFRFGQVRHHSPRRRWLDLHNLLGICTLLWMLVVGITGVLNAVSKPLSERWRATEMSALLGSHRGTPVVEHPISAQAAFSTVRQALPDRNVTSLIFPSRSFSNPAHFLVWTNGNSPLTHRLFTAALIDARTGALTAITEVPWPLRLVQLSRPLHFGDYGGLPLKVIWAMFNVVTIVILLSGIVLFASRRVAR